MKMFLIFFLCGVAVLIVYSQAFVNSDGNPQNSADLKMNQENAAPAPDALPKLAEPRIVIKKKQRVLELFDGAELVKTYKIALGFAPDGDKEKQGDGKTPEGEFYIFTKNDKSKFYLSLGVSYPNIEDAKRGLKDKIITKAQHDQIIKAIESKRTPPQNTRLGGEIYIHGGGVGKDWTWGCAALDNKDVKEIFDAVSVGASVVIEP